MGQQRRKIGICYALMISSHVPKIFWREAALTAAFLINRMPSRVLGCQTPCPVFLKSYPKTRLISSIPLKVFECSAFVHVPQQHRGELDPKATKCIFLKLQIKRNISAVVRLQRNSIIQWMLVLLKTALPLQNIFRGRVRFRGTSFGNQKS